MLNWTPLQTNNSWKSLRPPWVFIRSSFTVEMHVLHRVKSTGGLGKTHAPLRYCYCLLVWGRHMHWWDSSRCLYLPDGTLPSSVWIQATKRQKQIKIKLKSLKKKTQSSCTWACVYACQTLESVPEQGVQLRVELGFLLEHVEEQLVLCGAVYLRLFQTALHHFDLRLLLCSLKALR